MLDTRFPRKHESERWFSGDYDDLMVRGDASVAVAMFVLDFARHIAKPAPPPEMRLGRRRRLVHVDPLAMLGAELMSHQRSMHDGQHQLAAHHEQRKQGKNAPSA